LGASHPHSIKGRTKKKIKRKRQTKNASSYPAKKESKQVWRDGTRTEKKTMLQKSWGQ